MINSLRGIAPSILAADPANIAAEVNEVLAYGASVIHVDVMDGHFVSDITFGPAIVKAISKQVKTVGALIDVHLMVDRPDTQIEAFAAAGADAITIHVEASASKTSAILQSIRQLGCLAGVSLRPSTAIDVIDQFKDQIDLCLVMSVDPGKGGQPFLDNSPQRIEALRSILSDSVVLSVDGGINSQTAADCAAAGATLFVAGSSLFKAKDREVAFEDLVRAIELPTSS